MKKITALFLSFVIAANMCAAGTAYAAEAVNGTETQKETATATDGTEPQKAAAIASDSTEAQKDAATATDGTEAQNEAATATENTETQKEAATASDGTEAQKEAAASSGGTEAQKDTAIVSEGTEAQKEAATATGGTETQNEAATATENTETQKEAETTSEGTEAQKDAAIASEGTEAQKDAATASDGTEAQKGAATASDGTKSSEVSRTAEILKSSAPSGQLSAAQSTAGQSQAEQSTTAQSQAEQLPEDYTYKDGKLYFHDLELNDEGMYEYTDEEGRVWEYDPMDPEFLHYFGDKAGITDIYDEPETDLLKGSGGDTFTSGINDEEYTYPDHVEGKKTTDGIDVSYYQGEINWEKLAKKGVKFAIIRAGYRGYGDSGNMKEDPMCHDYIDGAYSAGIKVGIYFLSQAKDRDEAEEEAEKCEEIIHSYRKKISLPVFMDYEYAGSSTNPGRLRKQHEIDMQSSDYREKHTRVVRRFCSRMVESGYTSGVYANRNMLENQLNVSGLSSESYIWMANYTHSTPYEDRLECWQYTSTYTGYGSSGYVGSTNVDLDVWFGTLPGEEEESKADEKKIRAFVSRLYRTVLEREAEKDGLDYWTDKLMKGDMTGAELISAFFLGDEIKNKKLPNSKYVELAYKGALGRNPDTEGNKYWTDALDSGASPQFLVCGCVASQEFTDLCKEYGIKRGEISVSEPRDKNLGATKYVSRLYTEGLGRKYDVDGLNYWCDEIDRDPGREHLIEVAMNGCFHSEEFLNKKLNNGDFVKVMYRTFLGRDYDKQGYDYWTGKLAGGMSRDEMISNCAYSEEFSKIMSSYGL